MKLILSLFVLPIFVAIADPHASWFEGDDEQGAVRQTAFATKKASRLMKKTTQALQVTGAKEIECKMSEEECLIAHQLLIDAPEFHAITKGQKIRLKEGREAITTNLWLTIDVSELENKNSERIKVAVSNLKYDLERMKKYTENKAALAKIGVKEIVAQTRVNLEECNTDLERFINEKRFHPLIKGKTIVLSNRFNVDEDTITLNINTTNEKMIAYLKAQE